MSLEILVETKTGAKMMGRTATNHIVHVDNAPPDLTPGDFVTVEISHAGQHSLKAEAAAIQD